MKKQSVNSIVKRVFLSSVLALVLFVTAQESVYARGSEKKIDSAAANAKVSVSFLGSTENGLVFNVKYDNVEGTNFVVAVTDESGEVLYQDYFSDKKFDKKFLLPKDVDAKKISFSIKSDKGANLNQTFAISTSTKIVEDVVVSRN